MTRPATPDDVALLREAEARFRAGDSAGALRLYDKAGARSGKSFEALAGAANVHLAMSEPGEALKCAQRAARLRPDDPMSHVLLARVDVQRRRLDDALGRLEAALAAEPENVHALYMKGELLQGLKRHGEALEIFAGLRSRGVRHTGVLVGLSVATAHVHGPEAAAELCEAAIREAGGTDLRAHILHRMARLMDDLGRHEQAFDYAARAKQALRLTWNAEAESRLITERIEATGGDFFERTAHATNRDETPVFIVGMPRSGTSLLEQMLACHPKVHGAGELRDIPRIVSELHAAATDQSSEAARLRTIPPHMVQARAEAHLRRLHGLGGDAARVTDKLPHNFLYLPEIAMLLPGARVIRMDRDARDTCVSCYLSGLSNAHAWSSEQTWIARHYADSRRLLTHFECVLPIPMLKVRYEDLVRDTEGTLRAVVDFLGLEWDDACLRHERSERPVHTASATQATRAVYGTSVGRWARYGDRFAPLLAELERLGAADGSQTEARGDGGSRADG